jgi:hypothetical protein
MSAQRVQKILQKRRAIVLVRKALFPIGGAGQGPDAGP